MLRHCTIDELLACRDGGGLHAARTHVAECDACRGELERLHQRQAAMRALPTVAAPRDRWPVVRKAIVTERRRRRWVWGGGAALAAAALALVVGLGSRERRETPPDVGPEIANLMEQSRELEAALRSVQPRRRVFSGYAANAIAELEDRIAVVDVGIAAGQEGELTPRELRDLWRERVALMGTLINTTGRRASYVGF